jgi:hypothetical protein
MGSPTNDTNDVQGKWNSGYNNLHENIRTMCGDISFPKILRSYAVQKIFVIEEMHNEY